MELHTRNSNRPTSTVSRTALQPLDLNSNEPFRSNLTLDIPEQHRIASLEEEYRSRTTFTIFEDPPLFSTPTPPDRVQVEIPIDSLLQRRIESETPFTVIPDGPTSSTTPEESSTNSDALDTSSEALAPQSNRRQRRSSSYEPPGQRRKQGRTAPQGNQTRNERGSTALPGRPNRRDETARISYMLGGAVHMPDRHNIGSLEVECRSCHALHFPDLHREARNGSFYICCGYGKILPDAIRPPPEPLKRLLTNNDTESRQLQTYIVKYNNALAFTSCIANQSEHIREGFHTFVIRGELFHYSGPIRATSDKIPQFAQTYLYDSEAATDYRLALQPDGIVATILRALDEMLREVNPFIAQFRTAAEIIEEDITAEMRLLLNPQLRLIIEQGSDRRRTNLPTTSEIAVIIPNEFEGASFRDIVLYSRSSGHEQHSLRRIHPSHPAYMALAYPILFPYGDAGWHWVRPLNLRESSMAKNRVTQRMWYRHFAFFRTNTFNVFKWARRLSQRYWVDAFAVIDQERMEFARRNQKTFRSDLYRGLQDIFRVEDEETTSSPSGAGHRVILPASYIGGDRFMRKLYQDSMALLRRYGKPSLFVTMTANPNWPEIKAYLPSNADAASNPAIAVTVFHRKRRELLEDLKKRFGRFVATCWTVEYQKRGLPHAHILLWLAKEDSFLDPTKIDDFIRAELPGSETDPDGVLRRTIEQHMIHGPCGELNPKSPCMAKDSGGRRQCSKRFPKPYCEETTISESGYPQYRRRNTTYVIKRIDGVDYRIGNEWVVPHSPFLSRKFDCHINMEVCESVQAIRYIHKYVYKGDDRTTMQYQIVDEVQHYLNGRYIGPMQAAYSILEYPTHQEWPPIETLTVHLPGMQAVSFPEGATPEQIRRLLEEHRTTLLAFFEYNEQYEDGRSRLYHEFPEKYVYVKTPKPYHWKPRQKGIGLGRLIHLSPCSGERYYLRLLLTRIPGPTCFEDLRTVDGQLLSTFKEACRVHGFLEDDGEWVLCFAEAAQFAIGGLRHLLVIALVAGDVVSPRELWDQFKEEICEGLSYRISLEFTLSEPNDNDHIDYGLYLIQKTLLQYGKTLEEFSLPPPIREWERRAKNPELLAASDYDPTHEQTLLDERLPKLNRGQQEAYNIITEQIERDPTHAHFFLQGPGGTGKTFLYTVLCNTYRAKGDIVLCVASSGIAALLLPGGRTAHSRFGIPLECTATSTCRITKQSHRGELIRRVRLIIWDEAPMQHKNNILAVNNTLRDIRESDELFGGIPIVFGGDFAQILPVVPNAGRAGTIDACLRRTQFWGQLKQLRLTENMRLSSDTASQRWAEWIRSVSYETTLYGAIALPSEVKYHFSTSSVFYQHVFPLDQLQNPFRTPEFFTNRAILAPHNDTIHSTNLEILDYLPGETYDLHSVDSVDVNDDTTVHELSAEYLASLNPASLPPSHLRLRIGAPIMIMRNMHPREGLCNGTRATVLGITRTCIKIRIAGGSFNGAVHAIPRIKLTSNEGELPWIVTRKQFPIRLCFAMTINKAQGQSLPIVGIDLRLPCFSHGQFYVAVSRVTNVEKLSILWRENNTSRITENVVYPEVLEGL
jgi:PIF1-like helicase/Helitron helicase-like domain at N-terminus